MAQAVSVAVAVSVPVARVRIPTGALHVAERAEPPKVAFAGAGAADTVITRSVGAARADSGAILAVQSRGAFRARRCRVFLDPVC